MTLCIYNKNRFQLILYLFFVVIFNYWLRINKVVVQTVSVLISFFMCVGVERRSTCQPNSSSSAVQSSWTSPGIEGHQRCCWRQYRIYYFRFGSQTYKSKNKGQDNQFNSHFQKLPALSHQMLQGESFHPCIYIIIYMWYIDTLWPNSSYWFLCAQFSSLL